MSKMNETNVSSEILDFTELCIKNSGIDPALYGKYDVKRGLRDINGNGVLAGLTEIGEVKAYDVIDGKSVPCEGKLFYRGIDIEQIVDGFIKEDRFGFEEVSYLLLFGELPSHEELKKFENILTDFIF